MPLLSKQQILAANDIKIQKIDVPEWGGEVYLRTLKGWERDQFDMERAEAFRKSSNVHARAKLVSRAMCDEKGFSLEFTQEEVLALSDKSSAVLDRLFDIAATMCGIMSASDKDADAVIVPEDSAKNSNGQSGDSG